jgi:L-cysteate sulfo-lyase
VEGLRNVRCLPRERLVARVTPIERLARLEAHLRRSGPCPRIFVKRDDLTGIGGGGNKLRKLEFLLGDVSDKSCDVIITVGARQSNHARLTAACAARAGLSCELILADRVPRHDQPYLANGNLLLDKLFGAEVRHVGPRADLHALAEDRAAALRKAGRRPYIISVGGSSPVGCLGYALCAAEIADQERELNVRFDDIIVPNGSSGTHAGLAAGFFLIGGEAARVSSFAVSASAKETTSQTNRLFRQVLTLVGAESDAYLTVEGGELGRGYGVPPPVRGARPAGKDGRVAFGSCLRCEGLFRPAASHRSGLL